ncbi:hypothetical protein, partial [Catenulispora rubra]|uniref:hypothetical protein n=1 Tax=Catenulispora rubra TaxID=280293 RepID=UPI001E2E6568
STTATSPATIDSTILSFYPTGNCGYAPRQIATGSGKYVRLDSGRLTQPGPAIANTIYIGCVKT